MKIIISPAKSLEEKRPLPTAQYTIPEFFVDALKIRNKLAKLSKRKIADLMHISDKLAALNQERYQEFDENNTGARPAIYMYDGDVYKGLDAYTIPTEKLDDLQQQVRILSGLYGLLKPMDLIQPYRLEMGVKLPVGRRKDLYAFWREKITATLNEELSDDELFINLASKEYATAVDFKQLKVPVVSPVFKDFKNGKLKIISFFAKQARGAMVRYILDKNTSNPEELKGFDAMGYRFSERYTEKESEPVFVR